MTSEVDYIDHAKRAVWVKFITNVGMEVDPVRALAEAGYGVREIPTIVWAVNRYRTSGVIV